VSIPEEQWPTTDALIHSVEWIPPCRNDWGHYSVKYSYSVEGEQYTGKFNDYTDQTNSYLRPDGVISIRYRPDKRAKNYYPERKSATVRRLISIGVGLVFAISMIWYQSFKGCH
jgi:hypothetical protein